MCSLIGIVSFSRLSSACRRLAQLVRSAMSRMFRFKKAKGEKDKEKDKDKAKDKDKEKKKRKKKEGEVRR